MFSTSKNSIIMVVNIVLLLCYSSAFSQGVSVAMVAKAHSFFLETTGENSPVNTIILLDRESLLKNYVFNFKTGGFVIVQENSPVYTVLGFSKEGSFSTENNLFLAGRGEKAEVFNYIDTLFSNSNLSSTTQSLKSSNTINPFMTDVWGGVNCKDADGNTVYPTNYYTHNHCSPGCVAIATSQILNYYEWPIKGVGNNVYSDNFNGSQLRHESFFDNTTYDWANMLDKYYGVNSTSIQQQAVGTLLKQVGVALQMDFEPTGSTSNLNKVPFILENFFRYSGRYELISWSSFWQSLYDDMQLQRPVPLAVKASVSGDGHVIVANGYQEIGGLPYYYINWGWWNNNNINGWYYLQGWNPGTSGYNTVEAAIFDILPEPEITSIAPNGNANDFIVSWAVSDQVNYSEYILQQKVDQGNWEDVATGIIEKDYTISNPTGQVYQFRVRAKVDTIYSADSWSETEVYAVNGNYNGYASFEGSQNAYARQTPDFDLNFTSDYTFETWINLQTGNQNGNCIFDQQDGYALEIADVTASDYSVIFKNHSNTIDELASITTGIKLPIGQWQHIAVSKSGNIAKLFINGELRDLNSNGTFTLKASNYALNFGEKFRGSYTSFIKADLDQIRFSDIGRYLTDFIPNRNAEFSLDNNTSLYCTFQDVHKVRLKDNAHNLSIIVKNEVNHVTWDFEFINSTLSTQELRYFSNCIKIYPNPTSDYINFEIDESIQNKISDLTYSLYDLTGKQLKSGKLGNEFNQPYSLNIESLKSGIYTFNIKGEYFTTTIKLIINH